jgi:hypothetical protein
MLNVPYAHSIMKMAERPHRARAHAEQHRACLEALHQATVYRGLPEDKLVLREGKHRGAQTTHSNDSISSHDPPIDLCSVPSPAVRLFPARRTHFQHHRSLFFLAIFCSEGWLNASIPCESPVLHRLKLCDAGLGQLHALLPLLRHCPVHFPFLHTSQHVPPQRVNHIDTIPPLSLEQNRNLGKRISVLARNEHLAHCMCYKYIIVENIFIYIY